MDPSQPPHGRRTRAREQGQTDPPSELARRLPFADPAYLDGALDNPALSAEQALTLLKTGKLRAGQIRQIADGALGRHYEIRAAIVGHPATPPNLALNLIGGLFWRDLARVADNYRLYPPLRRRAERMLADRLGEMAEGEMISLARIAGRSLIRALPKPHPARVTAALLGNPSLVEEDVLTICRSGRASSESLSAVAHSSRWKSRRPVQLALLRNPSTPIPDSLRCLKGLVRRDLEQLSRDSAVRPIVRIGAERRLGRRPSAGEAPAAELHI